MQNTIFSTSSDCFLVPHILHAGPVSELNQQNRKSENTHYFKLTTVRGSSYCHFRSEETARRSRGVLGAMLGSVKPNLFRSKGDSIDISSIVSFGRVVDLKKDSDAELYGFPVVVATMTEKNATIWLTFQAEESAKNVRKALYAAVMSYYTTHESALVSDDAAETDDIQTETALVDA